MYRKHQNGQIPIEEFHVPFGGTLCPDNPRVFFFSLMPWEELEEADASQFNQSGVPWSGVTREEQPRRSRG